MSLETTSKRLFTQIGDRVVVTDINICQRILPAKVDFKGIEQVVEVDELYGRVTVEFEGYESEVVYDGASDIPAAKRQVALCIADMLEDDGVIVTGRPQMTKFQRPKGHTCGVSTNVFDILTFGRGKLDANGFWQFGCDACARAHEEQFPDEPCWPHTQEQLVQMGFGKLLADYNDLSLSKRK